MLVSACSKNEESSTSSSPGPSADASATPKSAPPATLRILTENNTSWPPKADWGVWKWVEEQTNIKVKQELQTGPESLALAISSGDMPDMISVFQSDVQKFGPQGAFEDLSKNMSKMPNVKAFLDKNPEEKARVTAPTGEIFNLYNSGAGEGSQMIWFYRDDIFQKNNLTPPKTWEDLYETAKKLKALYPGSYPFVFRHGMDTLNTFGPTFGFYPEVYPDPADPAKVKFGLQEPGAKMLVDWLHKFQEEGLMPPDWLTMDYKAWTQFITTNKSFVTVQFIGQLEIMNNQMPEGHLKFMVPPIGSGSKPYLPKAGQEGYGLAVASTSKNKDAAFRLLDYLFSEKGKDIQSWGKEGETYSVVNGKRVFNSTYKEPNDLRIVSGIQTAATYGLFDFNAWLSLVKESEREAYVEAPKYRFPVAYTRPSLTPNETAAVSPDNDQIWKFWTGEVSKFINGGRPMADWDKFVGELKSHGLSNIMTTYQKALDRQNANTK
ncbi:extracellular solute-binding protein [Paenibacillus aurantius]|uniref:Extracellular solute-binding protein n=1 Tax=Paenibacillus aurantius TaxID=2918900 RepID=A0AA96LFW9_9BACL|nr:extracellular solute-binding protein [Paenibacillus aurantius]WNQ12533.1 extracellular solute-binding protein [Paenibacillus aurantius]